MSIEPTTPPDQLREFVIAGHGNLAEVQRILAEQPQLLNRAYEWGPNDTETALQAAAHVGSRPVAEYLLAQGAPLDICTAAMLGREADITQFLAADPTLAQAVGAHGIPLMAHAALSGNVALVEQLWNAGARAGASEALSYAVSGGDVELSRWLLENTEPDLAWENFQGKTVLEIARERGPEEVAILLEAHRVPR